MRTCLITLVCVASFAAPAAADSVIKVKSMTVDGLEVRDLECSLAEGGFMASMAVVGALAKQKKPLDACSPAGAAFVVEWAWDKTTTTRVSRSSAPKKAACVAKAIERTTGPKGRCKATPLAGKSKAAREAADGLKSN